MKIALGGIIVIALAFFGFIWMNKSSDLETNPGEVGNYVSYKKGPETAKVKIVEYADFQCPACAAMHPLVSDLFAKYPNDIEITFKHFPLSQIHPNAIIAAKAAEAAGKQGKFFEMHDILFEKQSDWSRNSKAEEIFTGYAQDIGLDVEKFKLYLKDKDIAAKIKSDYAGGVKQQVQGTPTFFVNGIKLDNNGALISKVEELLK